MAITLVEGGEWLPFPTVERDGVHAIKFDDGSVWDRVNGWRQTRMSAFDYYKDARQTGMITVDESDALDAILEHLEDAVEAGDWFEINEVSAALLLAHIQALEEVVAPVCVHPGRRPGRNCKICGYGPEPYIG